MTTKTAPKLTWKRDGDCWLLHRGLHYTGIHAEPTGIAGRWRLCNAAGRSLTSGSLVECKKFALDLAK